MAIVNQRHFLNICSFYSHLAIARENAFLCAKKEADKKAKKQDTDASMDTAPEVRVVDILDEHLKQLGLTGRKSLFDSPGPSSQSSRSRSRSLDVSSTSTRTGSDSSRSSSRSTRGCSAQFKRNKKSNANGKKRKFVRFNSSLSKNGDATTSLRPKNRRGRGGGSRQLLRTAVWWVSCVV